jgi:hypothetical protein
MVSMCHDGPMPDAPDALVKLVNLILMDATRKKARRILLSFGGEGEFEVAFDLAGVTRAVMLPPRALAEPMRDRLLDMADAPLPGRGETALGRIHVVMTEGHQFFDLAVWREGPQTRLVLLCLGAKLPSSPPSLEMFHPRKPLVN